MLGKSSIYELKIYEKAQNKHFEMLNACKIYYYMLIVNH